MNASQGISLILLSVMAAMGLLAAPGGSGQLWAKPQGAGVGASGDKLNWREIMTLKHEHAVHSLACSTDLCAASDEGGNAFVWSTKNGKDRTVLTKGTKEFQRDWLQFTVDGNDLYGSFAARKGILRHPVKDKKVGNGYGVGGADDFEYFGVSGDGDTWLEFLDEGRTLLLRPNIYTRNHGNGKPYEAVTFKTKVTHAIVSADNKWLAVATDDGTLQIRSRDSLQQLHTIASGKERVTINDIRFSMDGQRVAVARDDAIAKVYDTAKGEEIAAFKGHLGIVFAVAFSPDGKTVVSGGDDNVARLWDAWTGKEVATLKAHTDSVRCVAFDPTGEFLVTGSADKTVKLWQAK